MLYLGTGRTGELYAMDIASGKLRWKLRPLDSALVSPPATDGRCIFVTTGPTNGKTGECALLAIGPRD
jgi:hypothetical protein